MKKFVFSDYDKFPKDCTYASYVTSGGWTGHKSKDAAVKAAKKRLAAQRKQWGGCPTACWAEVATGQGEYV
jgi:hypothetical protein